MGHKRAQFRRRNPIAKDLHTEKYRPRVKPKAFDYEPDLEELLEDYYADKWVGLDNSDTLEGGSYADRDESGRSISEAPEGGAQQRISSEDQPVSNGLEPSDGQETQGKEEGKEVNEPVRNMPELLQIQKKGS